MDIFVSLEPAGRREGLPASFPVAYVGSLIIGARVGVSKVSLEVVFSWESFVAAKFGTDEGSFLIVAAHV